MLENTRRKILILGDCKSCPLHSKEGKIYFCNANSRLIKVSVMIGTVPIPEWCELEDAKE